jgi:hypothetical protein
MTPRAGISYKKLWGGMLVMLNEREIKERVRLLLAWVQQTKKEMDERTAAYALKMQKERERKGVANYE